MKKNKIIIPVLLTGVLLFSTFSSCKKDYLDINTDPNNPTNAPIAILLPSAQAGIAQAIGNSFQIDAGLYAQYWTQNPASSQYKTNEQYSPSADDFDRPWGNIYFNALTDLQTIISKATVENKPQYVAIAKILEAYSFQVLTDNFGDIPFSESLNGVGGVLSPRYDSQQQVYAGIFRLLNEALAVVDENAVIDEAASADLIYGGDMYLWKKFANTLMLRASLRLTEIDPGTAQANIDSLTAHGAEFLSPGDEAKIIYFNEGGNFNPLYSATTDLSNVQSLVASATAVDYMLNNNDDRVGVFYGTTGGNYIGIPQGEYTLPPGTAVSLPSPLVGADANDDASAVAPVKFMTVYESLFLQAEAVARGWMAGDAQALYEEGITESFTSYDLPDTLATNYFAQTAIAYPTAGTFQDQLKAIITQKWVAMCGNQNNEAWAEARRTNYPDFFTLSTTSIIGNHFPARFFYPSTEVTRNANFPGQKLIYDKVWWDAN